MSQYSELLKHPKWQEKRLRILERDAFSCSVCGEKEQTLHVHHGYYERGKKPWEYAEHTLHSLCETCHSVAQERLTTLHRIIGGLASDDLERLRGYAIGLEMMSYGNIRTHIESYEMAEGIANAWTLPLGHYPMMTPAMTVQFPSPVDGWMLSRMRKGQAAGELGPDIENAQDQDGTGE